MEIKIDEEATSGTGVESVYFQRRAFGLEGGWLESSNSTIEFDEEAVLGSV